MNLDEEFKKDIEINSKNGKSTRKVDGMNPGIGCNIDLVDDETTKILFDNGNLYTLKGDKVIERIDGQSEYFICQHIEDAINNFILSNGLQKSCQEAYQYNDCVESPGLIKVVVVKKQKVIAIPTLLVPLKMHYRGLGKKLINEIYKIACKHGYKLHLVQMVAGFYEKMVKRGAKIIDPYDIVEITPHTKLT